MISLVINNSYSKIDGLSAKQFAELKDILSYTIPKQQMYFSKNWRSNKRTLLSKREEFPTGLLYLVEAYLHISGIEYSCKDMRLKPFISTDFDYKRLSLNGTTLTPYPEQIDAVEAIVAANGRGIITMPTGVGKSLVAVLLFKRFQVNTLIVVPTLELKRQLTETFDRLVGLTGEEEPFWCVENIDAIDTEQIAESFDMVIIDEFHHSAAKTYRDLNKYAWKDIPYRVGLTATPFRSQDHERLLLESILSEVVYKLDYKTAVEKGYIVPVEAYYIDVPKTIPEGNTYAQVYKELVVKNSLRNYLIRNILDKTKQGLIPTLCLIKEIEHGNNLVDAMDNLEFANGQDGNNKELIQAFNANTITNLVGTTGILGEGVDTKPAEYIIIAGLGKSKNQFMQQVGRGLRTYPGKESCKVIIFKDESHKWTLAHFKEQCKILKEEYGVKPIKL